MDFVKNSSIEMIITDLEKNKGQKCSTGQRSNFNWNNFLQNPYFSFFGQDKNLDQGILEDIVGSINEDGSAPAKYCVYWNVPLEYFFHWIWDPF